MCCSQSEEPNTIFCKIKCCFFFFFICLGDKMKRAPPPVCPKKKERKGGMFYSCQSNEEWVDWICQSRLNHTVIPDCDTNGGGLQHGGNKQTGLQGDGEDFWGWNQCAYYENAGISGPDDGLRAWRRTAISREPCIRTMYTWSHSTD